MPSLKPKWIRDVVASFYLASSMNHRAESGSSAKKNKEKAARKSITKGVGAVAEKRTPSTSSHKYDQFSNLTPTSVKCALCKSIIVVPGKDALEALLECHKALECDQKQKQQQQQLPAQQRQNRARASGKGGDAEVGKVVATTHISKERLRRIVATFPFQTPQQTTDKWEKAGLKENLAEGVFSVAPIFHSQKKPPESAKEGAKEEEVKQEEQQQQEELCLTDAVGCAFDSAAAVLQRALFVPMEGAAWLRPAEREEEVK